MSTANNVIFKVLQVAAWIIFIGLSIEAGGLIVNFIFSLYNPGLLPRLYQKLDLTGMYSRNRQAFFSIYSFILIIAMLKAYLFYIVIRLLSKMNLEKPFSSFVAEQVAQLSYFSFAIGLLSYIARQTARNAGHRGNDISQLDQFWADSQAFILMAGVIYVIAVIFSKGVELQNENELTV